MKLYIVFAAIIIGAAILLNGFFERRAHPTLSTSAVVGPAEAARDHIIAVLPFTSIGSGDSSNSLAAGIEREILTRLSALNVSAASRPEAPRTGELLLGSVQQAGNRVRINVQLVDAASRIPRWAQTYDRELTDILGVESEVAKAVADALQAKLADGEQQPLVVQPTNNLDAYEAYVRGFALESGNPTSLDDLEKVLGFYEEAVRLDPDFAMTWARLSRANAKIYFNGLDTTAARREASERASNRSQILQPNSPEALLAEAYYQYWVLRDYKLAKATFGRVRELSPADSDVIAALAAITRQQEHGEQSVTH